MQTVTASGDQNVFTADFAGFYVVRLRAPAVGSGGYMFRGNNPFTETNPGLFLVDVVHGSEYAPVYWDKSVVVWLNASDTIGAHLSSTGSGQYLEVSGGRFAQDEF